MPKAAVADEIHNGSDQYSGPSTAFEDRVGRPGENQREDDLNNAADGGEDIDLFHGVAFCGFQVLLEDRLGAGGAVVPEDILFLRVMD